MSLILPSGTSPGATRTVEFERTEPVLGVDGRLYEMRITGTAAVTRGPLGRFLDLRDQILAEGLTVPPEISDALDRLNEGA